MIAPTAVLHFGILMLNGEVVMAVSAMKANIRIVRNIVIAVFIVSIYLFYQIYFSLPQKLF